jgi:hypothetical protein
LGMNRLGLQPYVASALSYQSFKGATAGA